jgi:hypothetical protein
MAFVVHQKFSNFTPPSEGKNGHIRLKMAGQFLSNRIKFPHCFNRH